MALDIVTSDRCPLVRDGTFRTAYSEWGEALVIARAHGWTPAGVMALAHFNEQGAPVFERSSDVALYCSSDHAWIQAPDARNIAAALRRAISMRPAAWWSERAPSREYVERVARLLGWCAEHGEPLFLT